MRYCLIKITPTRYTGELSPGLAYVAAPAVAAIENDIVSHAGKAAVSGIALLASAALATFAK